MTNKEILENHFAIADFIAAANGPTCEVLVHDLSSLKNSIVHIVNGEITGRTIGGSITDFGLEILQKEDYEEEPFVVNYLGTAQKNTKILRCSTYYIRNEENRVIGLLCVNNDITDLLRMQESINNMVMAKEPERSDTETGSRENFDMTVDEMVDGIIQSVVLDSGIKLTESSQEEKRELVRKIYDRGVFKFKGTVNTLASILEISTQSVYRYLKDIENESK
jgi:predicted transcriptional regulator YheO